MRLKVKIKNPNGKVIDDGMEKVVIKVDEMRVKKMEEIKKEIERYYGKFGKVKRIYNEDGFLILDKGNVWDYVYKDEVILIELEYKKYVNISDSSSESDIDSQSEGEEPQINTKSKENKFLLKKTNREDNNKKVIIQNNDIETKQIQQNKKCEDFYVKHKVKNNKEKNKKKNENNVNILLLNYEKIPPNHLDNYTTLYNNYPYLFKQNTFLKYKSYQLGNNGIEQSNYKYAQILEYNFSTNSFLIKLLHIDNPPSSNSKSLSLLSTSFDQIGDEICLELKNIIELHYYSPHNSNSHYHVTSTNSETNKIPFIQRQIEYYFSDRNYPNDTYLQNKKDENDCKFINIIFIFHIVIDIDVIMKFNKIKCLSQNKSLIIEAIKGLDSVELDEQLLKIRKKKNTK